MEAAGAFIVSLLPYITPIVAILLVWLAKKLTAAVEANQNASASARSAVSFALKAAIAVAAVEQKNRKAFEDASKDGKITAEEAKQLAALAIQGLLESAAGDLDGMGITDPVARQNIASAAVEAEVFRLPHKNRVTRGTVSTAAMEKLK